MALHPSPRRLPLAMEVTSGSVFARSITRPPAFAQQRATQERQAEPPRPKDKPVPKGQLGLFDADQPRS